MTEYTAAAAHERLSGYHRDRIRRAAKEAGVVNVTYKSKAENVAAMVALDVVDITDADEPVFNFAIVEAAAEAARDARAAAGLDDADAAIERERQARLEEALKVLHEPSVEYRVTIDSAGASLLTVVVDGELHTVRDTHPLYKRLTTALLAGDDPRPFLTDDVDALLTWVTNSVSDRVSVEHARDDAGKSHAKVLVDGEEVHGKVVDQFKRYFLEGREPANIIAFLERVKQNPLDVAEVGLYNWDSALTIDKDGYFIGFKSVRPIRDDETGEVVAYEPSHRGPGAVNGVTPEDGRLRMNLGDVVTFARELVRPGPECSVGLHVGTWTYARGFLNDGVVMEVRVDPADIVNVPRYETGKLRCVRFEVVGFHDANGVLTHHEPEATFEDRTESIIETIAEEDVQAAGFFRRLFFGKGKG